mgnify:CR=1 FL=1
MKDERKTKKQLIEELNELRSLVAELEKSAGESTSAPVADLDAERMLTERIKELDCLYAIDQLSREFETDLSSFLRGLLKVITASWQFPEITEAGISYQDAEYHTPGLAEVCSVQEAGFTAQHGQGWVKVGYRAEKPGADEGPFLDEERKLIDTIAKRIATFIDYKETREERERILNLSQDLICIAGDDGYFKYVNPAWERVLGYTVEEMLSRPFLDFIHPEDHARNDAEVASLSEGNRSIGFENRYLHRDGPVLVISWTATALEQEGHISMYCIGRDITQRKQMEEALRASEQKYRVLVENSSYGVVIHQGTEIVYANPAAVYILGYSSVEEIVGKDVLGFVHPDFREQIISRMKSISEAEGLAPLDEEHFIHKDGTSIYVEVCGVPITYNGKQAIQVIFSDISDRKRAELRIEHLNAVLRAVRNVNQIITQENEPKRLCQAVCDSLVETRGYKQSWICLLDNNQRMIHATSSSVGEAFNRFREQLQAGNLPPCGRKSLLLPDQIVMQNSRETECKECPLAGTHNDQVPMTISLNHRGKCYGLLSVSLPPDFTADKEEWDLFKELASDLSLALHGIEEAERRRRAEEMLELRIRIAGIFLTLPDEDMYYEVLNVVLEVMESPLGVFGYIDTNGDLVVPTMTRHVWDQCQVPEKDIRFPRQTWGDSTWVRALLEKRPVCDNAPSVKIPEGHLPISRHIAVPIVFQNQAIGLFEVANKETDYTENDINRLKSVAKQISPILNTRLQRERAEAELRRSEETYRNMIVNLSEGFYSVTPEGTLLDHNYEFNRILGFDPNENLVGIKLPDFWQDPRDRERYLQEFANSGVIKNYVINANKKDGEKIVVQANARMVKDEQGNPVRIEGAFLDVTGEKEAEEALEMYARELERSNKELEEFAYVASHDLQEPLRMVSSYTQLLARRYKGQLDADADEFIQFAVDGAIRMQQLIEGLLSYSRISTRGQEFKPTNLQTVLGQVHSNLKLLIEENNALITKEDLPTVPADENQMVQLFQNLIGNAIKYRSENTPNIRISAERQGPDWVIAVQDNGIGIDPQYQERIFTIFEQLHKRGEYTGTGIGLAICKRIVERHEGRIWVESEPGQGSTFYFTLPAGGIV